MKYRGCVLFLLLVLPGISLAADLDGFIFKKISAYDRQAVVKSPQGELVLVKAGDRVGGSTIVAILDDRVVLEHPGKYAPEKWIVRIKNGRQTIDVMKREPLHKTAVSQPR